LIANPFLKIEKCSILIPELNNNNSYSRHPTIFKE
jgi:hypothetical protein